MKWFAKTAGILLLLLSTLSADDAKPATTDAALAIARRDYLVGQYDKAEHEYEDLLKADSKLVPAEAGLARVMLQQKKIDEALDFIDTALAAQPNSATLLAAKGDVQFRRGEMSEAELAYLAALKVDAKDSRAHLGLARLYGAYSMRRRAYDHIQKAHENAPDDLETAVAWASVQPREKRAESLEYFLAAHPDYKEEAKPLAYFLGYLKMAQQTAAHTCKLVSKDASTDVALDPVIAHDARRSRGVGLTTKINDQTSLLQLDTGASGILINRRMADSAKLVRIGAAPVVGIGDQGARMGYVAIADRIQIGGLEFRDCAVRVADSPGFEGLIGADVFSSYLVDIDLAAMRFKLSPLPKRPDEAVAATALQSDADDDIGDEGGLGAAESSAGETESSPPTEALPKDRYVAPEMADWTKIFRFGHMLLVPTSVNDAKFMLFLLDTGSVANLLSVRAGKIVSKVKSQQFMRLNGLNGTVNDVYSSKNATLRFGHLEQKNKDIVTIDLSKVSRPGGMEVSGILGYEALMLLDVKLDYRDGLADFVYDPTQRKK